MAEFWYNDGSVRKAKELYYNDGVSVRQLKEVWYNDGTGVRKVFSFNPFTVLTGIFLSSDITSTNINPQIRFQSNGEVLLRLYDNSTNAESWGGPVTTGIGSNYTLTVATPTGNGAGAVTGTFNSAQSLSSEVIYTMTAANSGNSRSAEATYTIKDTGGNTVGTGTLLWISDRT